MCKLTLPKLKELTGADSVGRKKNGNVMFRQGFYYSGKRTHDDFCKLVQMVLVKNNIAHRIVDSGEKWTSFNGGASVANSTHWYVEVELIDKVA